MIPLLSDDLHQLNDTANLMACREYVDLHEPVFWKANLYNLWLDSLRTLHADMSGRSTSPKRCGPRPGR